MMFTLVQGYDYRITDLIWVGGGGREDGQNYLLPIVSVWVGGGREDGQNYLLPIVSERNSLDQLNPPRPDMVR